MHGGKRHFLISTLTRLWSWKKQKRHTCPKCLGDNVELVDQTSDGEGYWRKEGYLCYDCDCEWEWTYQRPFFHWRRKIRAPKWARLD
jgi:hypothetical protein